MHRNGGHMLKDWSNVIIPEEEEINERLERARNKLVQQQILIMQKKLPVLVSFDGWGAAGKGSILGKIIKNIDPRFFKVAVMDKPTEDEKRRPFLYRYVINIPEAGKFTFMDGGCLDEVTKQKLSGKITDEEYKRKIESVKRFERQLSDNGYLVIKFFFHIGEQEQRKRLTRLLDDKNTRWRVSEYDLWQNQHYKKSLKAFDQFIDDTSQSIAPWYIVDATDKKWVQLQILETLVQAIDTALKNSTLSVPLLQNAFPLNKMEKLSDINLNKSLSDEEYEYMLKNYQKKLNNLHNIIYKKKIPVIIAYEGWDAAGKGGNIRRITEALDPRGYEVQPIASPEPHEKARHYLWRFWNRLPKSGHVTVFDRTWYGRVMVERLEGFCSENDWQRAYVEINEFEKELSDWGAVIVKFWVQIDKDTQLARFKERENTPEKRWKITDEDWRNREKWDLYENAVNEMFAKTNTTYAPWHILESNDKKYARIKALKILIDAIEEKIKETD